LFELACSNFLNTSCYCSGTISKWRLLRIVEVFVFAAFLCKPFVASIPRCSLFFNRLLPMGKDECQKEPPTMAGNSLTDSLFPEVDEYISLMTKVVETITLYKAEYRALDMRCSLLAAQLQPLVREASALRVCRDQHYALECSRPLMLRIGALTEQVNELSAMKMAILAKINQAIVENRAKVRQLCVTSWRCNINKHP
ncbi:hypothetical protein M513_03275, partial [Trichuris suis]